MVNTPGQKIKSDQNTWGTGRARLRDNFKNPCITPLITILRQVMKWRL